MKRIVYSLVMVSVIICSGEVFAAGTIKLGVPGAHSGDLASHGLPAANAAKLVVDGINAKGGILGRKVVVLKEDDQCKPEVAANVAAKLVSDKADAVLGHFPSHLSGATSWSAKKEALTRMKRKAGRRGQGCASVPTGGSISPV